jgi:pSer/pThr/pTyr-binding forkhead associated (FHA) protein
MADVWPAWESPIGLHRSTPQELTDRLAADRAGMPYLVYRDDAGNQVIQLLASTGTMLIGRDERCEIRLEWDGQVSGVHAVLEPLGRRWALRDGGSLNGTFLNSERVQGQQQLRDRDELLVGRTAVLFRSPDTSGGVATRPGSASLIAIALSDMDRRVLAALARPLVDADHALPATNKAIADELCMSVPAVKKRLGALFIRFNLAYLPQAEKRNRLAVEALKHGIVRRSDQ